MLKPTIFREYDIRGVAETELLSGDIVLLGKGLGTFLQRKAGRRIAVGSDCRLSSPRLKDALIRGLMSTGCEAIERSNCGRLCSSLRAGITTLTGAAEAGPEANPPARRRPSRRKPADHSASVTTSRIMSGPRPRPSWRHCGRRGPPLACRRPDSPSRRQKTDLDTSHFVSVP